VKFERHRLANGLEVVAECNPEAHSAAVGFFVRTGARDETSQLAGVSHFLEHMVFKGTPARSADEVNREFDRLGAHYNAFTNEENTVYYAAVLPECLQPVVALWADILRPALRQEDFELEKQVILEEIRMYEDQPPFGADEKCRAAFFDGHPLGNSVLGTVESISALPVEAMRDYFRRRYAPTNILLAAAGKVDFGELVDWAEKYCGGWEGPPASRRVSPPQGRTGFHLLHRPGAAQQYVMQLAAAPGAQHSLRHAAKLLAIIVGDELGSRLYWELIEPGLAEHAALHHGEYQEAGVWMATLSCRPDRAAENLRRLAEVFRAVESRGVTAEELDQAKNKCRARIVPRGRLFTLADNWVYRREYRSVEEELEAVGRVTLDQLNELLSQFPLTRSTTMTIGPLERLAEAG